MMTPESMRVLFSPAELRVLWELQTGASNKEIARRLGISPGTVKTHMRTIQRKAGTANRTQTAVSLFYVAFDDHRAQAAMDTEFSGKLVLVTWNDDDHKLVVEMNNADRAPVQVGSEVDQRAPPSEGSTQPVAP